MEVITWAFPHKGNAEKCYRECETLSEVTPENVLDKARDDSTELHKCFEWDNSIAGEKYRLIQARDVIRHFVIEYKKDEEEPQKIRTYQISTTTNQYKPARVILQNPDEYAALLERAKDELRDIQRRYNTLAELEEVFAAIDAL
jgi:hypothetical protein